MNLISSFRRVWVTNLLVILAGLLSLGEQNRLRAADPSSMEKAAARLQAATVTVRIALVADEPKGAELAENSNGPKLQPASEPVAGVTVCSGVSLGQGRIVTSAFAAADSRIRVTFPGGRQAEATLLVIDDYTNLALLQLDARDLPFVELSPALPNAGAWVVSAAGWGTEQPVVSLGVVAGTDRLLEGGHPPLLQCDLRTDDTSAGAGIVDRDGRLVGIVAAVHAAQNRRGWTYAVPVLHVQRLLNAQSESLEKGAAVILKRRRPTVGIVLSGEAGQVVVSRVTTGSPAEKAGIREGDVIVAADGVNIRSVYQAIRPVLHKQPGEEVEFLVRQADQTRRIRLMLEGGVELPGASLDRVAEFVRPNFHVQRNEGFYISRDGRGEVRQVIAPSVNSPSVDSPSVDSHEAIPLAIGSGERAKLLERANERYLNVIVHLREQLGRSEVERLEKERLIESLQAEIERLKQPSTEQKSTEQK